MTDVTYLDAKRAEEAEDNRLVSPVNALRELADEIERGETKVDGVLILMLDKGEEGDQFITSWSAANMMLSQMIAVCETAKSMALHKMGYPEE